MSGCIECGSERTRDEQKEETYRQAIAYAKERGLCSIVICKTINGALYCYRERDDESLARLPIVEYLYID